MSHATIKGDAFTWHNITRPTRDDISFIRDHFALDEVDEETLHSGVDIARFHDRGDWHMLALHIPALAVAKKDFERSTLYILFSKTTVVTVVDRVDSRLSTLFDQAKKKGVHERLRHGTTVEVLAWLLAQVLDGVDEIIDELFVRIGRLEHAMKHVRLERVAHELGILRRDVLMLDLMLHPQVSVLDQLLHTRAPYRGAVAEGRVMNLRDRLYGMHVVLEHYAKLIEGLFRVHETTLTHRTNQTVQLLTAISVLLMPPTLIASYYGMNIKNLPLAHDFRLVTLLLIAAVLVFIVFVYVIYRKK